MNSPGRKRIPPMAKRIAPIIRRSAWDSIHVGIMKAMREPTEDMLRLEISLDLGERGYFLSQEEKREIWQEMIDEAMK